MSCLNSKKLYRYIIVNQNFYEKNKSLDGSDNNMIFNNFEVFLWRR